MCQHFDTTSFAIIEEYIDVKTQIEIIKKFISAFKHTWISVYFSYIEPKHRVTFDDIEKYMRHPSKFPDAIEFTRKDIIEEGKKYNLKDKFEQMYDQFAYAYWELYQNAPNSHLDLHHGNIGFTYSGTLKVFDIQ